MAAGVSSHRPESHPRRHLAVSHGRPSPGHHPAEAFPAPPRGPPTGNIPKKKVCAHGKKKSPSWEHSCCTIHRRRRQARRANRKSLTSSPSTWSCGAEGESPSAHAPSRVSWRYTPRAHWRSSFCAALRDVEKDPRPDDAPDPPGRRQAVCRLLRPQGLLPPTLPGVTASPACCPLCPDAGSLPATPMPRPACSGGGAVSDFLAASHVHALILFGGVPAAVVREQLLPWRASPGPVALSRG